MGDKNLKAQLLNAAVNMAAPLVAKIDTTMPLDPDFANKADDEAIYKQAKGLMTVCYAFLIQCLETDGTGNDFKDPTGGVPSQLVQQAAGKISGAVAGAAGAAASALKP